MFEHGISIKYFQGATEYDHVTVSLSPIGSIRVWNAVKKALAEAVAVEEANARQVVDSVGVER